MSHSFQQPPNRPPHWQLQTEISQAGSSLTTVVQTHRLQNKISPFDFITSSKLCLFCMGICMMKVWCMLFNSSFVRSNTDVLVSEVRVSDQTSGTLMWVLKGRPCTTESSVKAVNLVGYNNQFWNVSVVSQNILNSMNTWINKAAMNTCFVDLFLVSLFILLVS